MSCTGITAAIESATDTLRLLDHRFYRAWQENELRQADLSSYAKQYRHFEQTFPEVLSTVLSRMSPSTSRNLIEANLSDETSNPRPHVDLFNDFASAVGAADTAAATEATRQLVGLYRQAAERGPVPLLAVIAAYETQAAEIAATKVASLSGHYRLSTSGTEFWQVHAEIEGQHSQWTIDALECLEASPSSVEDWAARSAQVWWEFLDERDAGRA